MSDFTKKLKKIIGDYEYFISNLLNGLSEKGIELNKYYIDHLCYRTETLVEYNLKKEELMSVSRKHIENIHHGRPISKFILKEDIVYDNYSISIIELPAPKDGYNFESGLEHLEFVVGDDFDFIKDKYSKLWDGADDSGPYNQTVFLNFGKLKVKFHKDSLLNVLKMEKVKFIDL